MSEQQKFTMPLSDLVKMIGMVSHATSTDQWVSDPLRSVQFTIGAGLDHIPHYDPRTFSPVEVRSPAALSLAATDRFRLVWATSPCKTDGAVVLDEPIKFMVTGVALKALAASFPKVGRGRKALRPDVTIERLEKKAVRFTVKGEDAEQATTLATLDGAFPDLRKVVTFDHPAPKADEFAVNPMYAAQMFAGYTRVFGARSPVAMSSSGVNKPVRFATEPTDSLSVSGLLMVVKQN